MNEFLSDYKQLFFLISIISFLCFIGSILLIPLIIRNLSPDYFEKKRRPLLQYRHPLLRYSALIIKNIMGYVMIILGFTMLFIPGQGLLSITLGLILINFPGKKRLEYKFFTNKNVSGAINAIRRRSGKKEINFKRMQ